MNMNSFRVPMKPGGGMPTYQQQQQYPTPGVDTSARLSDTAAQIYQQGAAQQAQGMEKLGQGLEQASKAGYDLYTDYQTTQAKDAWLQYKQGAQKLQAQLGSLSGKDAIDDKNGVIAQMKTWREQTRAEVAGRLGGMAAGLFDRAASETDATLDSWATGKVHAEGINYGNATSKAQISLAQNQALADAANPAAFGAQLGVIKAELENIARRSGYDDAWVEAGLQDIRQKTLIQAISDSISGEQLGKANSIIKDYAPLLGGHVDALRAKAAAKGRELEARSRADSEMRFVGAFANDPLKGIAEISTPEGMAKYGMDAKTAISVRSMLQTQWSFNKTVEKQKNDNYVTSTVNGIYSTLMGDPDKGIAPAPAKAYQDLQNSNLDAITKIEMGKKLEEGTIGKTRDPAAVNDMARQIVNGSIDSDAPIDMMLAQGKASVGDVTMLKGMRKDMDGPLKDYLKRADNLIKNAYARSQFAAGTPEAAIKEDRARSQLSTVITEAYKKGGPESVEKLFNSDTPMSIMNSNAITVDDALSNVNRVISAGGAGKEKKPKEGIADNLKRNPIGGAE
ncbi:hypothetical protein [Desulfovibrio sp.]|uniref:hypothetical protein n=1 Tax=Desulfovibrio sp. TaxID=885 RepID=UPI0025C65C64|nr:hypothetical protein [Desulfovibrio sp.]